MTTFFDLKKSTRPGKKYTVVLTDAGRKRTVHFGAAGMSDYTKHGDPARKQRYLARHKKREDWTWSGRFSAGFWSRWVLWNEPSVARSLASLKRRFSKLKGGGRRRGMSKKYLPESLTPKDRRAQLKSIVEGKRRPKVKSFKSRRSGWAAAFEKKYGTKVTDKAFIGRKILKKGGIDKILKKGKAAYFTSGSRPNQTPSSWAYARLASVIMGGPARKYDKAIWRKYKV